GDKVRMREGEGLEYAGRVDEQVKIRGYRIELGEIEAVLNEQEGVKQSAVVMKEDGGEKRLGGDVELRGETRVEEVKSYLKRKLPEYMVPVKLVEVEGIGLTAHGKLDRKKLPEVEWGVEEGEYEEPRGEEERELAEVWKRVLGLKEVGR